MKGVEGVLLGMLLACLWGCAHPQTAVHEEVRAVYRSEGQEGLPVGRLAPAFVIHHFAQPYNRIGTPSARWNEDGEEEIYIDPHHPVIYFATRRFFTPRGAFTNLIYRIHFPEVPVSLIPFHLTAGKNVGIIVIITIDRNECPLLVTTFGTCGCYAAIVPTRHLPFDALPLGWKKEPQRIYGERLPAILDYADARDRLVVHLRSGVHRVMDLEVVPEESLANSRRFTRIPAPLKPVGGLNRLPINGKTTSFYYTEWPFMGHVKGSFKPWETLFMSWMSLDLFVGADKIYGDRNLTGNPFYTSLKPWNRKASDAWRFPQFLQFHGWRL